MQPLIDNLNPEQRAAVEATEGPLLILAGAGSGKTRVITSRIAWLIHEKGVAPDSILAVTFTNKAASEMAERVDRLLGHSSLAKPLISTFHSLCVRLLRRDIEALKVNGEGLNRAFAIYDENDQQGIVKQIMRRMGLDTKQLTPRTVLGRISWAKSHMVDPQEYYLSSKDPNSERIAHIYQGYRGELRKNNALDFDDLLLEAVRLLKVSTEARERYQRRYRYLLVDEYQDTNRPQYELMKLLAGEAKNVCAVGDEDQSIYSWRGADIRNILEFEKDFPNARIVRLEQNYRSTQIILEAAGSVVANNVRRKGKKLWTDRQGGSLIGYYEAPDGENEALFIADRIQKFQREGGEETGEPGHCAVLYRTNSQSRLVEEALRRYNISYTMVGGFSFYERAEIKDLLGYLRLVRNPHDSMALQRVINTPARGTFVFFALFSYVGLVALCRKENRIDSLQIVYLSGLSILILYIFKIHIEGSIHLHQLYGIILAAIGGIGMYLYSRQASAMMKANITASQLLAVRFYVTIFLCIVLMYSGPGITLTTNNLSAGLIIGIICLIAPTYFMQKAIEKAGPEVNAIICSSMPLVAAFFEQAAYHNVRLDHFIVYLIYCLISITPVIYKHKTTVTLLSSRPSESSSGRNDG